MAKETLKSQGLGGVRERFVTFFPPGLSSKDRGTDRGDRRGPKRTAVRTGETGGRWRQVVVGPPWHGRCQFLVVHSGGLWGLPTRLVSTVGVGGSVDRVPVPPRVGTDSGSVEEDEGSEAQWRNRKTGPEFAIGTHNRYNRKSRDLGLGKEGKCRDTVADWPQIEGDWSDVGPLRTHHGSEERYDGVGEGDTDRVVHEVWGRPMSFLPGWDVLRVKSFDDAGGRGGRYFFLKCRGTSGILLA